MVGNFGCACVGRESAADGGGNDGAAVSVFLQPAKNVAASTNAMNFPGFTPSACGKPPPFSIKRCSRRTPPGRRKCKSARKITGFDFDGGGFYEILYLEDQRSRSEE